MKDNTEQKRRFLTIEQVAEELNVGIPIVRALLKSGELRGFQIGGRNYLVQFLSCSRSCAPLRRAASDIGVRFLCGS